MQSVCWGSVAFSMLGELVEMQTFRPHLRGTELESTFSRAPGDFHAHCKQVIYGIVLLSDSLWPAAVSSVNHISHFGTPLVWWCHGGRMRVFYNLTIFSILDHLCFGAVIFTSVFWEVWPFFFYPILYSVPLLLYSKSAALKPSLQFCVCVHFLS